MSEDEMLTLYGGRTDHRLDSAACFVFDNVSGLELLLSLWSLEECAVLLSGLEYVRDGRRMGKRWVRGERR